MADELAQLINPVKAFNWKINVLGVESFLCQKVTPPTFEIGTIPRSTGRQIIEDPGLIKAQELVCEYLTSSVFADKAMWLWLLSIQNYDVNAPAVNLALGFKRPAEFILLNPDGITRAEAYSCIIWPKKYELTEADKNAESNMMKKVTFSCQRWMPLAV